MGISTTEKNFITTCEKLIMMIVFEKANQLLTCHLLCLGP